MSSWYSSDFQGSCGSSSSGPSVHSNSVDSPHSETLNLPDDFFNRFSPDSGSSRIGHIQNLGNHRHTIPQGNYDTSGSVQAVNEIDVNEVCAKATHNDLIRNSNLAYYRLLNAHSELQGRHNELRTLYSQLQETIKNITAGPTSSLSHHAPATSFRKNLKRQDVPNIKYFYQRDYTSKLKHARAKAGVLDPGAASSSKQKGGTRLASNNENVQMDYVEDEDGVVVNGDTAKQIRGLARSVLIEIDAVDSMKLPSSWSNIGISERTYFVNQMYEQYPILALCDNDWKVHYLASRALSTYHEHLKRKERAIAIKSEPKEMSSDSNISNPIAPTLPQATATKRKTPPSSSEAHFAKRQRDASLPPTAPAKTMANTPSVSVAMAPMVPNPPLHFSHSPLPTSPRSLIPASPRPSSPPSPRPPSPFLAATRLSLSPRPVVSPPSPSTQMFSPNPLGAHQPSPPVSLHPASPPPLIPSSSLPSQATKADEQAQPAPVNPDDLREISESITVENPFTSLFGPAVGPAIPIEALNVTKPKRGGARKSTSTPSAAAVDNVPKAGEPAKARRKRLLKKSTVTVSEDPSIDDDNNDETTEFEGSGNQAMEAMVGNLNRPGRRSGTRLSSKSTPLTVGDANANVAAEHGPQIDPTSISSTMKKTTRSVAPKNLCYIDYLKTNDATTTAIFEEYWKKLGKAGQKVYNDRSKQLKAAENSSSN